MSPVISANLQVQNKAPLGTCSVTGAGGRSCGLLVPVPRPCRKWTQAAPGLGQRDSDDYYFNFSRGWRSNRARAME